VDYINKWFFKVYSLVISCDKRERKITLDDAWHYHYAVGKVFEELVGG
jgi:predicted ATPase